MTVLRARCPPHRPAARPPPRRSPVLVVLPRRRGARRPAPGRPAIRRGVAFWISCTGPPDGLLPGAVVVLDPPGGDQAPPWSAREARTRLLGQADGEKGGVVIRWAVACGHHRRAG